jgi:multiple antibiotic resistance protein
MGITVSDFKIAGGILLLSLSVNFLLPGKTKGFASPPHGRDVGIFPLGTPLITGPAVLTTTLMIIDEYGLAPTYISLILNMTIAWAVFIKSDLIMNLVGIGGTRAFSKVADILLASIAITMIRGGVIDILFSLR